MTTLDAALTDTRHRIETALNAVLPDAALPPERLHEAMRYATLAPGKRLRPFLVYQAGGLFGETGPALDPPACAVEMIHAYSLIHDDLPAMDDDDLRRGRATCHRAFDEATAILAGDALQSLAFRLLAAAETPAPAHRLAMIETLAAAIGSRGMAGGQALDLAAVGGTPDAADLEDMHSHKTGALILASLRLGVLAAGAADADAAQRTALDAYGRCIGLAFQVQDDILDVAGDPQQLGKASGADARHDKTTYPGLLGMEKARAFAVELKDRAIAALEPFGSAADPLRRLAEYVIKRDR
ncbi:polyprenyl synthetase family protein [Spiribacter pallidus]|jgi:farnesyl diphosphate synthase|uniref:polyprenyl synthetase family protein n=1 Tax=Spiribacter pallidus TaxID=1987936 RepID=UPI0034A0A599